MKFSTTQNGLQEL